MSIRLKQTRDIFEFGPILEGLLKDFGYVYWSAILEWCRVIGGPENRLFWQVWLVTDGDSVVGICGLYSLDKNTDHLWLGWFGIIPAFRNSGKGSKVLRLLESEAICNGCKTLRTYVDEAGKPIPFYERHGFQMVSTVAEFCRRNGHGIEHFESPSDHVMEKQLQHEPST